MLTVTWMAPLLGGMRGRPDRLADALCDRVRARGVGLGEDQRHLLSAIAGHDVRFARLRLRDRGDPLQHRVARGMAKGVVHLLEVVHVQEQKREGAVVALGLAKTALELRVERAPVEEPGQAVGRGQELRLLVEARAQQRLRGLEREHRQLLLRGLGQGPASREPQTSVPTTLSPALRGKILRAPARARPSRRRRSGPGPLPRAAARAVALPA